MYLDDIDLPTKEQDMLKLQLVQVSSSFEKITFGWTLTFDFLVVYRSVFSVYICKIYVYIYIIHVNTDTCMVYLEPVTPFGGCFTSNTRSKLPTPINTRACLFQGCIYVNNMCMYICMYVYIYVCMCINIYIYVCIYIYTYMCTVKYHKHIHIYIYRYTHTLIFQSWGKSIYQVTIHARFQIQGTARSGYFFLSQSCKGKAASNKRITATRFILSTCWSAYTMGHGYIKWFTSSTSRYFPHTNSASFL